MKKAYFSRRIYKNELPCYLIHELNGVLQTFNHAKRFAFHTLVREKRWGRQLNKESLHKVLKKKFGLNDYYANSARQETLALSSSLTELQKLYIKQTDEKIKGLKKKLKKERIKLTKLLKVKDSLIKGKLHLPKNSPFLKINNMIALHLKNETRIWLNDYLFEHQYLDVQIKHTKSQIGRLVFRLYRLEERKQKYKTHIPSCVFGGKKLFKSQFTIEEYQRNHEKWQEIFHQARTKQMMISGRKDAKSGNFVFQYNIENQELRFTSMRGKAFTIPFVLFPYGQEIVNNVILTQQACKNKKADGQPISWSIEDHRDYYIIKCLAEVTPNPYVNFSTSDGVIGVDCNVDHFAWADLTNDGNYLESGKLKFSIEGKTSGQITKVIEAQAIGLVDIAVQKNKPIVLENLDTTLSKTGNRYADKKANRLKSLFAYKKMIIAVTSRAEKMGIDVIQVNPKYTSVAGKLKYMRKFGISIHQAAAFTIGRRGLGYKDKPPKILHQYIVRHNVHHWRHWYTLNKKLNIRTHLFYTLFNVNTPYQSINLHDHNLIENERKKLFKALA
ncbi:IS200/IS605 family accessory protein TnpB-related protein [Scopulibacillus cellulosilyticus]|uniref:IS200/IS605 family accessory protein TnpB-related protein n=1 Tax=Scopulibacillus cellulosilyticus TaxID=2665665 RepID=A0ABW2PU58_9BACL